MSENASSATAQPCCGWLSVWTEGLAFLVAAVGVMGSLYLTWGLGLTACPLCLYQRMFAMAVVTVLLAGWLFAQPVGRGLSVLAFPFSVGGCCVACFHVYREWVQSMVCPLGLWEIGTAPQQSLAVFTLLTVLLAVSMLAATERRAWWNRGLIALVLLAGLGAAMAWGLIKSSPPPSGQGSYQELVQKRDNHELSVCTPVRPAATPEHSATPSSQDTASQKPPAGTGGVQKGGFSFLARLSDIK